MQCTHAYAHEKVRVQNKVETVSWYHIFLSYTSLSLIIANICFLICLQCFYTIWKHSECYADNSYTGTEFTLWSLTSNAILRKNTGLQSSVIFNSMFGTNILYGICLKRLTMHIRHFPFLLVVSMEQPSMKLTGPCEIRLYVQIMTLFLE